MNYDVYKSMDVLEAAIDLDKTHFFAQMKYSELSIGCGRCKARRRDSEGVELAGNGWEFSMARKQLQEIRRLFREGTQKPKWNKPLRTPAWCSWRWWICSRRWRCRNEVGGISLAPVW